MISQQAGLKVSSSFDLSMGQYAINTGGTLIAWFLMGSGVGRRTLYLYGTSFMFVFLIIIGGVSTIPGTNAAWASAVMLLCWSVAYQFSVSRPALTRLAAEIRLGVSAMPLFLKFHLVDS